MRTSRTVWAMIIALTLSLLLWGWRTGFFQKKGGNQTTNGAPLSFAPEYPTSGHTNIVHGEWRGVKCFQNGMRISAFNLTPGVWWQVRFDHRDDQVYDLYPMDWKTSSMLVITNSYKTQEWRIKPGDKATNAIVSWEITIDTGHPPR